MSIAGVPFRRKYNASQPGERAITFSCEGSNNLPQLPKHACPNGLKATIVFPSCCESRFVFIDLGTDDSTGNGRDLMTPDLSHVVYPQRDPVNGYCPTSHPKKLHTLQYDFVFEVQKFPYKAGSWVFSFGDNTGRSHESDSVGDADVSSRHRPWISWCVQPCILRENYSSSSYSRHRQPLARRLYGSHHGKLRRRKGYR